MGTKLRRGLFISFEGMEGAGKSTQAQLLVERLREEGRTVVATREPGGTRIGEQIRKITHDPENVDLADRTEAYLMAAARAQHVVEIIQPALSAGQIVVCDRFLDSSLAYQGYGRQLGHTTVWELNSLALRSIKSVAFYRAGGRAKSKLVLPDLTILLEVKIEVGMKRRNSTSKIDRLDLQQEEFYQRVAFGYEQIAKQYPERVVIVDGNGTIEKVADKIWAIVRRRLQDEQK